MYKLDVGTIGSLKCEISLNSILIKYSKGAIVPTNEAEKDIHFVLRTYQRYIEGLQQLNSLQDKKWAKHFCRLFTKEIKDKILTKQSRLPEVVETHLLCCISAHYRNFLKDN